MCSTAHASTHAGVSVCTCLGRSAHLSVHVCVNLCVYKLTFGDSRVQITALWVQADSSSTRPEKH